MNPQQPQTPQQPSSYDYLNQIAPTAQKKAILGLGGPLKPVHYILGGLLGLLIIILIVSGIVSATNGGVSPLQHLAARLNTTSTIANGAEANLKDTQLRSLNSNLKIFLTNTNRDITAPFKNVGVDTAKLPSNIVKDEAGTDVSARLEDARLNVVYDSTYAREMSYQLDTILTLMKQIYNSTSSKSVKAVLQTAYSNLQPTQEAFANFTTTTE